MKKTSLLIIVIGLFFCGLGVYLSFDNKSVNEDKNVVDSKDKEEILKFLSNKYNETFEYVSKDYSYCLIQKENVPNNIELDKDCSKKEIVNDIYKIKSKDGIEFFVKKVTLSEDINLLASLVYTESNGYYDNYLIFYLINKYSDTLLSKYNYLTNITNHKIYYGLGIEELDNNSMPYQSLSREIQTSFTKSDTLDSFIEKANKFGFNFNIGFYVKTNETLDSNNFQSIIRAFAENDSSEFENGIDGTNIIIEFNDKRYLSVKNGYLATLYEYKNSVFEKDSKRLYDNSILLNNDSFSDEGITLNKFLGKKTSLFKF